MEQYYLSFTVFITGIIILIVAYWFQKNPPLKINSYKGYRTKRSMKTQATWDFAQKVAPAEMIKSGIYLIFLSIITYFLDYKNQWINYAVTLAIILIVLIPIFKVEQKLKEMFP